MAKKKSGVSKPTKKKKSISVRIMLLLNFFFILLFVSSLLAAYVSPAKFWPLAFLGISYPFLLLINLFFVLFWIVFLRRYFLYSLLAIVIGYPQLTSLVQFRSQNESITSEGKMKVMSFNVRLFDLYNWKESNQNANTRNGIFELIRKENPDILCLQEYYNGKNAGINYADSIKNSANCPYYYDSYINNGRKLLPFGLITFSKYPILSSKRESYGNSYQNFYIVTDILTPSDTIRVINTHLESLRFGKQDYSFVNEIANNPGKNNDFKEGSLSIIKKLKNAFVKRSVQADELALVIEESPYKVILCADFNDTPSSYAYRQIARNHTDAFRVAGSGIGQTYHQLIPSLRIDYIFVDKSLKINDFQTLEDDLSDHYPITATISSSTKDPG